MELLREVLLIDDYEADNFLHRRAIKKSGLAAKITECLNGREAIDYLRAAGPDGERPQPEMIFVDINMPVMNGWEFLEAYSALPAEARPDGFVLMMLTTSLNPDDRKRAEENGLVHQLIQKPLTAARFAEVVYGCFPGRFQP